MRLVSATVKSILVVSMTSPATTSRVNDNAASRRDNGNQIGRRRAGSSSWTICRRQAEKLNPASQIARRRLRVRSSYVIGNPKVDQRLNRPCGRRLPLRRLPFRLPGRRCPGTTPPRPANRLYGLGLQIQSGSRLEQFGLGATDFGRIDECQDFACLHRDHRHSFPPPDGAGGSRGQPRDAGGIVDNLARRRDGFDDGAAVDQVDVDAGFVGRWPDGN